MATGSPTLAVASDIPARLPFFQAPTAKSLAVRDVRHIRRAGQTAVLAGDSVCAVGRTPMWDVGAGNGLVARAQ